MFRLQVPEWFVSHWLLGLIESLVRVKWKMLKIGSTCFWWTQKINNHFWWFFGEMMLKKRNEYTWVQMMQFSLGLVETPLTFHFYSAVKVGDSCNADSLGPQRVSPNCFHWFAWILENRCPKTESWKQLWSQVDWILRFFFANIFQNGGSFFVRRFEIYSKFPWICLLNFCSGGDAEIPCRAAEGVKRVTLMSFCNINCFRLKRLKG